MPHVFYATGHYRNGVLLAPLTARSSPTSCSTVAKARRSLALTCDRRRLGPVRLKKFYSSREVAGLTGLTARQLQWWDARRLFTAAMASHRTEAGGFTERRYTPLDVLELQVLADLRRRGFSVPRLRRLLATLRDVFGIRLYEAIGDGGPLTLYIGGDQIYAQAEDGRLFNLEQPTQPLLMVGEDLPLRLLAAGSANGVRRQRVRKTSSGSETPSRGRRRAAR